MQPQEQRQARATGTKKATTAAVVNRANTTARPKRQKTPARVIAERYHALAVAAGHIIWTTNSAGGSIDAADWYAYTGQSAETAKGEGWLTPIHPDDRAMVQLAWQQALTAQTPYEMEYRIRRADGVYRTFLVRGVPIFETDGTLREWTGFCTDITARKIMENERDQAQAEAAKRAGELEVIFEAIADGIMVVDQSGAVLHVNRAYCDLLALDHAAGFTTISLPTEQGLVNFRDERSGLILPECLPIARILRGEVVLGADAVDLTMNRRDGQPVILNVSGAPLTAADGDILGGVIVLRDVTQRRQLEQQSRDTLTALLKMAEALVSDDVPFAQSGMHLLHDKATQRLVELTRSVFGCQSVGVATIAPDRQTFTPAAVISATPAEEHFWWQAMQRARFATHFTTTQQNHLIAGDTIHYVLQKDNAMHDVLLAPIHHDDRLVGLLGLEHAQSAHVYSEHELALIKAVTRLAAITIERRRLVGEREEAVARDLASQEAQQRMDEFLSVISHELRAPLTLIKGNVQLAERRLHHINTTEMEATDVAERVEVVRALLQRADRQIGLENRLVSDLLDAARMHADHLELHMQSCDLVTIADEIVAEVRQVYPTRLIRFVAPPSFSVEADAERIGQVIMNYLTNALKYALPGQPIEVEIARADDMVRLSVRDRGIGLPLAEHERVWERFHRAPDSPQGGLGLGLYICRTIIVHHHGQVGLISAPGQGATFWFTLPLAMPAADG